MWCFDGWNFSWFRGKDLDKDEVFQEKLKDPEFKNMSMEMQKHF